MLFQDSSKYVYLKGESNTLYPGLEDPIFQLLSLCDFPHPFQLSGSPFSWCWLQSWLLIYPHCCCFPQMGLPLSQSGKRKGKKSQEFSSHSSDHRDPFFQLLCSERKLFSQFQVSECLLPARSVSFSLRALLSTWQGN